MSDFNSREEYLNNELLITSPKRWKINLPYRDFGIVIEDWVPALAATTGKIVMVATMTVQFGLDAALLLKMYVLKY